MKLKTLCCTGVALIGLSNAAAFTIGFYDEWRPKPLAKMVSEDVQRITRTPSYEELYLGIFRPFGPVDTDCDGRLKHSEYDAALAKVEIYELGTRGHKHTMEGEKQFISYEALQRLSELYGNRTTCASNTIFINRT